MSVRQPAVAGSFYPGAAVELGRSVDILLHRAEGAEFPSVMPPKALIVPHAGYIYSGPTAAIGYATLEPIRSVITRVVLLGPAHYVGFRGLALSSADAFATPLGRVPIDHEAQTHLRHLPQVVTSDEAHAPEHSLEVQLPFLQRVLDDFTLVPIVVGDAPPTQVAAVLEACWGGPETLLLISSDLSHYLSHDTANALDAATIDTILTLDWPLPDRSACGARPINGLMVAAGTHNLRPTLLDHRTSGDTAGDRNRVVGYASIAFADASSDPGEGGESHGR